MKKTWFLFFFLVLMIFTITITMIPALASDEPLLTTFDVKYELAMFDDSTLLFSEEPEEILTGEQYYNNIAYVFPTDTKVACKINDVLIPTFTVSETADKSGIYFRMSGEALETILDKSIAADENGVRICSSDRGLLTVIISGAELPKMTVKTEIPMFDGTVLLFSEKPVRVQWNITDFPHDISFVFPQGTKISQTFNGVWIPIYAVSEYDSVNRISLAASYGEPVFELELSEEMGNETYGVRICSTYYGRGLLPVLIDGVSEYAVNPGDSLIYMRDMELYAQKPTDEKSLNYLRQPSRDIQNDDPEIITLSNTITEDISSDYEKARVIHDWVSDNIWYDYDLFSGISSVEMFTGEETWYSTVTLRNKRGICGGYANLTAALLRAAGIPAKVVSGYSGEAHGWNEAYVDGRWINIDTTWDSVNQYTNGEYSPQQKCVDTYFDMPDFEFAKTHIVFYYADYILENQLAITEPDPPETQSGDNDITITETTEDIQDNTENSDKINITIPIIIIAAVLVVIGVILTVGFLGKKKK